jgi:hypothetical protein
MSTTRPEDRLHEVPEAARAPLLAVLEDAATLPGPPGTLTFHGPATPQYQAFVAGEPPAAEVEVLGVTTTHSFRLVVGDAGADLAVRAASVVQDDMMDELGCPWPELALPNEGSTVLQPATAGSGTAEWQGRGARCAIGTLQDTFGHLLRPDTPQ